MPGQKWNKAIFKIPARQQEMQGFDGGVTFLSSKADLLYIAQPDPA